MSLEKRSLRADSWNLFIMTEPIYSLAWKLYTFPNIYAMQ